MSSITHSGSSKSTTYNFAYTTAGLTDTVKVGTAYTLVDNAYNSGTWTLASQTYGNGDTWQYTYNEFDDLVSAYTTGGTTGTELKYFYNSEGDLARVEQYTTTLSGSGITARTLVNTERYYYDTADRLVRVRRTSADTSTQNYTRSYDSNNNVTSLTENINTFPIAIQYTYDADQRITSVSASGTGTTQITSGTIGTDYNYDGYGRVESQTVRHDSATVLTETLTYRTVDGAATGQIATLHAESAGYSATYSCAYDDNGNITSVSDGTNTTSYVYDTANQLLRENNQAAGKTTTWTYDNAGNILTRTEYAYTTGALGTPTDTVTYTYGDGDWGDLLTAYDGQAITYDTIGNPLSDGTWNYTWEHGRQLASMTNGTTTWTYEYDANGMRTSRSNGTTTYTYAYDGTQLSQMNGAGKHLRFTYDVSGRPMTVYYNDTTYYYSLNAQGDVMAILRRSGEPIVEYTYDAWGNVLSVTGSWANSLGKYNPLRYRGYVYDHETGLYYLQSRYYDPEVGRFLNADAYTSTGQGLLGNNMFVYCGNNPVIRLDPTGQNHILITETLIYALSSALYGFIISINSTILSFKAAISTAAVPLACIAALSVAVIGLIHISYAIQAYEEQAKHVVAGVVAQIEARTISESELNGHTVYVIAKQGTTDVVYVGRTIDYTSRQYVHQRAPNARFPVGRYDMVPIATGLTLNEARALEQALIFAFGLEKLCNMINSISQRNLYRFTEELEEMTTLIAGYVTP